MTARDDIRRMAYDIATGNAVVQPHELDAALDALAAEACAATLAEADAAITAVIERDRAAFPGRSSDRAALGAAREIIRNLAAPAADDLRGGFWPSMTGGLCSVCHIAVLRGGQPDPDCADCRTVAAPRPACCWPDCLTPEQQRLLDCGMPTTPIPDQRGACGCADRPADDTQQQDGGPVPCPGCLVVCETCG